MESQNWPFCCGILEKQVKEHLKKKNLSHSFSDSKVLYAPGNLNTRSLIKWIQYDLVVVQLFVLSPRRDKCYL